MEKLSQMLRCLQNKCGLGRDKLLADNARLREALIEAHETIGDDIEPYEIAKRRIDALAATQSCRWAENGGSK